MPAHTPLEGTGTDVVRVATAGDIHARSSRREAVERSFAALEAESIDLVLLAGDLTTWGEPEEAAILAAASRPLTAPVIAVLGNHDWHAGRGDEVAAALEAGGVEVLEGAHTIRRVREHEIGVVGGKGFVGGFGSAQLPDFGEPLLRDVYAETSRTVDALDRGLRAVANCAVRIVLLHYSPVAATLEGEHPQIWPFLGAERMAVPILEHRPDLVLHGHAHAGRVEGRISDVPVYNVSVPVIKRDFWTVEVSVKAAPVAPIR